MVIAALAGCSNDKGGDGNNKVESALKFSHDSGIYAESFELEITAPSGSEIYYTTDGSNPATSDSAVKYENKIQITDRKNDANVVSAVSPSLFCTNFSNYNKNTGVTCKIPAPSDESVDKCTVVKAVYEDSTGEFSPVRTETYFIGTTEEHIQGLAKSCEAAGMDLAVISVSMEYDDLFDQTTGIYVKGDIFDKALEKFVAENWWFQGEDTRKLAANYNQRGSEWERSAHIEFFECNADGMESVLSQDCGIRIQGNYSRSDLQKSFRFYAKAKYGETKFNYAIWGEDAKDVNGEVIDSFDTFIVRAGGNCAFTCKYNDTYWQQLAKELNVDTKASRPCVVYLNGEYWGLYVLEEDYSEDYFEDHYKVNQEDVIVYKGDAETYDCGYKLDEGTLPEGETDDGYYFRELFEFFDTHTSLKEQADYDAFAKLVDVDSVMDYFAVEVWINNKWDWPGKNWSMWKTAVVDENIEYADGRWRFSLYDVEFGGVSGRGDATTNTVKEDNYKPKGLLDFDTENPAVLCFAYLMTNDGFREAYCNRLLELSDNYFEKSHALEVLTEFENVYGPLFDQFYERYKGAGSTNEALNGGYASSKCIRDFLSARADYIPKMINWINNQFK